MATNHEQLEARVAFLEREQRRTSVVIDSLEARTDKRIKELDQHLDKQDANLQEFTEQVDAKFEAINAKFEIVDAKVDAVDAKVDRLDKSVNERFDYVYGQLADLQSNSADIRNVLATIVEKLDRK